MSCVRLVCRYRSEKGNKMRFCFGAVLVSLALSLSQSAQAGPIVGSEALAGNGTALGLKQALFCQVFGVFAGAHR